MKIGVFCSGGDAPGMNACIRAVVRRAISEGHEVVGINRGYQGLLDEDFYTTDAGSPLMTLRSVSGWSRFGGSLLRSSRSSEFRTDAGQQKAVKVLVKHGIDALVPIGGDGTFHGAVALAKHWDGPIVGCPGTIDNDLMGTDFTIGFSTAVQTAVEAVDKIRDTAESHERMFLVEVMGRHSGFIAVHTALAASAECVCIPETKTDIPAIVRDLQELKTRGKTSVMMIVAEGDEEGDAVKLNEELRAAGNPFSTRCVILGHLQRGGSPSPEDRILASSVGDFAVQAILEGQSGVMAGVIGGQTTLTRFEDTYAVHKPIPPELSSLIERLAN
ncbi:MAG: ATP-dependent 6-phosphofructokinase [Planctomycetales bacterium]|nr:ATP-dependent 6-phosphofructokinase [Planctomycetales bacterium]